MLILAEDIIVQIFNYGNKASILVFVLFILYGGYKKWWVFGYQMRECELRIEKMEEEKDAWRETALQSSNVATQAFTELRRRV